MKRNSIVMAVMALVMALAASPAWSQTVSAQVNGKVTDNGKPATGLQVVLTNQDNGKSYKMKTDKNGAFDAVGIAYGTYRMEVFNASGESVFKRGNITINGEGGAASQFAIDLSDQSKTNLGMSNEVGTKPAAGSGSSGGSQQPKMTKEQIEAIKAQNAKATSQNNLIKQATDAMAAKNWQEAINPLQQLIAADPNRYEFYSALGDAQLQTGQFDQAAETYQKGIQVAESNTTVDPKNPATDPAKKKAGVAKMYTNEGNAYLKLKKNPEAIAAFTKAAEMDPNPGTAWFNLCATQYNSGNTQGALPACDKAIAADPNRAEAYFIKGSLLIGQGSQDKEGKLQAPPGTADALNKYLQLAPDGPHANDVKAMLQAIGAKIETKYSSKKK